MSTPRCCRCSERAFALFYICTIASGAISPIACGLIGDQFGMRAAIVASALAALAILPLSLALRVHPREYAV